MRQFTKDGSDFWNLGESRRTVYCGGCNVLISDLYTTSFPSMYDSATEKIKSDLNMSTSFISSFSFDLSKPGKISFNSNSSEFNSAIRFAADLCDKCTDKLYARYREEKRRSVNSGRAISCDNYGCDNGRVWEPDRGGFKRYYHDCSKCYGEGSIKIVESDEEVFIRAVNNTSYRGGCFLTTACVEAKGLSDDCLELQTLRNFRDNVLLQDPQGRNDVSEYYSVAPKIVASINKQHDAKLIWGKIYQDIKKAVDLIMRKDNQGAYEHYKQMVGNLESII